MLSLSNLLNPAPSGSIPLQRFSPTPAMPSPATSHTDELAPAPPDRPLLSEFKMTRDSLGPSKTKPRGVVNFYPFENVDGDALREIRRFQVAPFGQILHSCLHIPYNSGKKDFYEKTGRESFEVFKYDFRVPGSETIYTIMWDYNVGLVRMTPFFKCCKYGKTVPAKMLNQNPGLKEITHSITGGSITAQGYWMPFHCAKAVCATFCYEIAGALIPIFGPSFPGQCIPPGAHDFQRMVINPAIIYEAQKEADMSRRDYHQRAMPASIGYTSAPAGSNMDQRPIRAMRASERRLHIDTRMPSPYSTDTEAEGHFSGPDSASSSSPGPRAYAYHSMPPVSSRHSWTAANHPAHATPPRSSYEDEAFQPPNPWLSAVPRFAPHPTRQTPPRSQPVHRPARPVKRPMDDDDMDQGYEAGESHNGSPALKHAVDSRREGVDLRPGGHASERDAAMLLLNLSVRDETREREQTCVSDVDNSPEVHRFKRRRATSC